MTPEERTKAAWVALKAICCADPEKAVRVSMVSEREFMDAVLPHFRAQVGDTKERMK